MKEIRFYKTLGVISSILLTVTLFFYWYTETQSAGDLADISGFRARSEDSSILLAWEIPIGVKFDEIELKIESEETSDRIILPHNKATYIFSDGIHGKQYRFHLRLKKGTEYVGDGNTASAMFLSRDKLPDLPLVTIETYNGAMPTCTYISAPEGAWGQSITDNEYIWAQLTIESRGSIQIHDVAEIRIRGNTSAYAYKKPYKIKLETADDLLFRGDDLYKDREWLLLPDEHNLKLESGIKVSELCELEWQPAYQPVNLIINGDWLGTYHLTESVKRSPSRVNISTNGFLIENDAYWWNEDGAYFQTPKQNSHMGYTFCYPSADIISESQLGAMYNFISDFERALYEDEGNYGNYIDIDSFSRWLLLHDILGTWDAGGSNMFLYKESMDPDNPFASKLKIGPAWDFSTAFLQANDWASIHGTSVLYYSTLMTKNDFKGIYKQNWYDLSDSLTDTMQKFTHDYLASHGPALQESWDLDTERWNYVPEDVWQVSQSVNKWFVSRTDWLNSAIYALEE